MSGSANQKLKLLYLIDILKEYTDESHPLSAEQICELLSQKGISAERKSIYRDISVLMEYGYDIATSVSPRGYFLAWREFEVPEVCLLLDAAESADFISPKKTRELTEKLEKLISKNEAKKLRRQVFIDNRKKSDNERVYINIDLISSAIDENKKITLDYTRREFSDGKVTVKSKRFTLSPYALCWADDHYYLICNNSKYDNLMHLRVDRIVNVTKTNEDVRHFGEVSEYKTYFDVADYCTKAFNMFGGVKQKIELRCKNGLLETIIDRFGADISFFPDGEENFRILVDANISEGLVGWILSYADELEILSPANLRETVSEKIAALGKIYLK